MLAKKSTKRNKLQKNAPTTTWTWNLHFRRVLLYQLSYRCKGRTGFEPVSGFWPELIFKNSALNHSAICPRLIWEGRDLNPRKPKLEDLQSPAFDHSATPSFYNIMWIVGVEPTSFRRYFLKIVCLPVSPYPHKPGRIWTFIATVMSGEF